MTASLLPEVFHKRKFFLKFTSVDKYFTSTSAGSQNNIVMSFLQLCVNQYEIIHQSCRPIYICQKDTNKLNVGLWNIPKTPEDFECMALLIAWG